MTRLTAREACLRLGLIALLVPSCSASTGDANRSSASPVGTERPADDDCEDTFPVDTLPANDDIHMGVHIPNEAALPDLLSETGLYADITDKAVHPALRQYRPEFQLWSDGADKERWIYIPECDTVDTSDMDSWSVPVGTRLFKEFSLDGQRIETRLVERIGAGPRDFAFASYLWNEDESEATKLGPEGLQNALGTTHDVPSKAQCFMCHGSYAYGGGVPSRALGFSAIQLTHAESGIDLAELETAGAISSAPITAPSIPGTEEDRAALGYLHANCGNCHNGSSDRVPQVDLSFWLDHDLDSVEDSDAWRTAVGQPTKLFKDQHVTGRIVPGDPSHSAVLYRMSLRGNPGQMPPIASEMPDPEGLAIIEEWIGGME